MGLVYGGEFYVSLLFFLGMYCTGIPWLMRYIAKITYIDEICAMQNQYLPLVSPFLVQYLTISISL